MNLEAIIAKRNAYLEEAKVLVTSQFKAFFEKHPTAESITWAQYTPHFNDGDACEFSVNEMELRVSEISDQVMAANAASRWPRDLDDEEGYRYGDGCVGDLLSRHGTDTEKQLAKDYDAICDAGGELGEAFKEVFGDHALVTATIDGIDVQEYDHD